MDKNEIIRERRGCLELRRASYLCELPEHPAYHINYYYPNPYYKKEGEYQRDGDWYTQTEMPHFRIHKDCFKSPQSSFAIASFDYDAHENFYELHFIGDRPIELTEDERLVFWELITLGNKALNKHKTDDEEGLD